MSETMHPAIDDDAYSTVYISHTDPTRLYTPCDEVCV